MGATAITAMRKPHKEENRISIHLYGYRISQKIRKKEFLCPLIRAACTLGIPQKTKHQNRIHKYLRLFSFISGSLSNGDRPSLVFIPTAFGNSCNLLLVRSSTLFASFDFRLLFITTCSYFQFLSYDPIMES